MKYYSLKKIIEKCPDAKYYMIYSMRSNGKTYAALDRIIKNYFSGSGSGAIIRRWDEDFKGKRGAAMFSALVENNVIEKYSKGKWTGVKYYTGKWYFTRKDPDNEEKTITSEEPFCYAFALTQMEHDKSSSYNEVTTIVFDEFISRSAYLPDEFVLFMNTLSTIIRQRDNVKIFMLGNTVNAYNPYFDEMGLTHARQQKKGTIEVYNYGDSGLKVAVEYADRPAQFIKSDVYFAFNNPRLKMITDSEWEIGIYPHCPIKYQPKDIKLIFFIKFQENLLQCEIIMKGHYNILYIHRKTTELKDPEHDIIFDTEYNPLMTYGRRITSPATKLQQKIAWYFKADKVFFQDNAVGEIVRNYMLWSQKANLINT